MLWSVLVQLLTLVLDVLTARRGCAQKPGADR